MAKSLNYTLIPLPLTYSQTGNRELESLGVIIVLLYLITLYVSEMMSDGQISLQRNITKTIIHL